MWDWIVNFWEACPDWIKVLASASWLISIFQWLLYIINKLRTKLVGTESKLKRLQDKIRAIVIRPFRVGRLTILYGVTYWSSVKVKPRYDYVIKYSRLNNNSCDFEILDEELNVQMQSPIYETKTEAEIVALSYLNQPKIIEERLDSHKLYQYVKMREKDKRIIEDVFAYNNKLRTT